MFVYVDMKKHIKFFNSNINHLRKLRIKWRIKNCYDDDSKKIKNQLVLIKSKRFNDSRIYKNSNKSRFLINNQIIVFSKYVTEQIFNWLN